MLSEAPQGSCWTTPEGAQTSWSQDPPRASLKASDRRAMERASEREPDGRSTWATDQGAFIIMSDIRRPVRTRDALMASPPTRTMIRSLAAQGPDTPRSRRWDNS